MSTPDVGSAHPVVELRRYTLHPGMRETLIDIFDREFVESQEAVGMRVIGQFRDVDRPDVFTWLRGFDDVRTRATSLAAFYDGPVWRTHAPAANATMIEWNDVHLLRPVRFDDPLLDAARDRAPVGAATVPPGVIVATVYLLAPDRAASFASLFEDVIAPVLVATGAAPIATMETDLSPNEFPRLPVRERDRAFVWLARFDDIAAQERHAAMLAASPAWRSDALPVLASELVAPVEVSRLTPTARSRLRP